MTKAYCPDTPTPVRYWYYTPETDEHWEEFRVQIPPRRLYPGRVVTYVRNRDIARHYCEKEDCLLCLPYR